ncbi:MAG: RNA polymerase sigma factor [Polyangiaceae bacterium]
MSTSRESQDHVARRAPVVAQNAEEFRRGLVALLPELRARAFRLTERPASADDLVQDTVERALRFEKQYASGTNLRAWAYQILFSVFVTGYRRGRRDKNALRELASDPCAWTLPDTFATPDVGARLSPATQKELDALPEGFRDVVELIDLGSWSYREAADELGVPVGTVMSRLHRGRRLLAERLDGRVGREAHRDEDERVAA